jgi:hypothetical protein
MSGKGAKTVPVTGDAWLNPQGRVMVTLKLPAGGRAILAVPHRDRNGRAEASQAYRAIMAALEEAGSTLSATEAR